MVKALTERTPTMKVKTALENMILSVVGKNR